MLLPYSLYVINTITGKEIIESLWNITETCAFNTTCTPTKKDMARHELLKGPKAMVKF